MKKFKIKKAIKTEVKTWCLDNLGTEAVRWWFDEDITVTDSKYNTLYDEYTLFVDVTEEEEHNLTYFILKYGR